MNNYSSSGVSYPFVFLSVTLNTDSLVPVQFSIDCSIYLRFYTCYKELWKDFMRQKIFIYGQKLPNISASNFDNIYNCTSSIVVHKLFLILL